MNLPDQRNRVSVHNRTTEFGVPDFTYRFDPFSVTLLETRLAGRDLHASKQQ